MRRNIGVTVLALCVLACSSLARSQTAGAHAMPGSKTMLLGRVSWAQLAKIAGWKASYDAYNPNPAAIAKLQRVSGQYRVVVVLGSWCSDSRREVPRLVKVLDEVGRGHFSLEMYGVDHTLTVHDRTFPKHVLPGVKAERVPTIVVLDRDGQEIGRVVETAEQPLEELLCHFIAREERQWRQWKSR